MLILRGIIIYLYYIIDDSLRATFRFENLKEIITKTNIVYSPVCKSMLFVNCKIMRCMCEIFL